MDTYHTVLAVAGVRRRMAEHDLEAARRQVRRAADDVKGDDRDPLLSIDEALGGMLEAEGEPKPDRLEEIRLELSTLEVNVDDEAERRIRRAREHLGGELEDQAEDIEEGDE